MNPIFKVVFACACVCLALYLVISEFLGGTDELKDTLDLKSLAHIREGKSQARSIKTDVVVPVASEPEEPVRDDVDRPDASTVLPRTAGADSDEVLEQPVATQGEQADRQDVKQVLADSSELVEEMSSAEAAEALMKETLGINAPKPPVRAVDVTYELPPNCEASAAALAPVAVQYRYESPTIKGASLRELEILMTEYRRCEGGAFQFAHNPLGKEDATLSLMQMRLDELKYFFLQHRVPKTALKFPDDS